MTAPPLLTPPGPLPIIKHLTPDLRFREDGTKCHDGG